jgi:low affinity Fe/Cu permease
MTAMNRLFTNIASAISTYAGKAITFVGAILIIVVWAVTGPMFHFSDTWQLVVNTGTTIITFLMVFLIQNSQNRDSAALQAKLDELLRAVSNARESKFIGVEHLTDEEIEELRSELEELCANKRAAESKSTASKSRKKPPRKAKRGTTHGGAAAAAAAAA